MNNFHIPKIVQYFALHFTSEIKKKDVIVATDYNLIEENKCPECGNRLLHEGGCKRCINCGWEAC